MACCNKSSVPLLGVLQISLSATAATLTLDGVLPVSGAFNVCVRGNCLDICSALPIVLTDAAGTSITNIIDRHCGNRVLLNKVACQARKNEPLQFCRSADTPSLVILKDRICAPTPVITAPAAPAA